MTDEGTNGGTFWTNGRDSVQVDASGDAARCSCGESLPVDEAAIRSHLDTDHEYDPFEGL